MQYDRFAYDKIGDRWDFHIDGADEALKSHILEVLSSAKPTQRYGVEKYELSWKVVDRVYNCTATVAVVHDQKVALEIAYLLNNFSDKSPYRGR